VVAHIDEYYEKYRKALLSEEEAKRQAAEEVRRLRYGKNDYFFIVDRNYITLSHPFPELIGKNVSELKDIKGHYVVRPMMEVALKKGKGFTRYWWKRIGEKSPVEKLSYSVFYPKWQWMVGTGVYIDDIEEEAKKKLDAIIEELRENFSKIRIGQTGYLFLFNGKKQMIIHPYLSGRDVSEVKNPQTGTYLIEDLMKAAKNPEVPFEYLWDKPTDRGNYKYVKQSYVSYFPPLDWYVASSVYKDEITAPAKALSRKIFYLSIIFLGVVIVLSMVFSDTLVRPIRNLIGVMKNVTEKGTTDIQVPVEGVTETRQLGEIFNRMLKSINEAVDAKDRYARKLERFNEELERTVEQRTKELLEANRKLQELDKLKTDFLSTVSHELRTPLTSVLGFARIIKKRLDEVVIPSVDIKDRKTERAVRQVRENLEIIIAEGERLTALINDVLDIAKIESGRIEWKEEDVDMVDVFERAVAAMASLIEAKGLYLEREYGVESVVVKGDRDRLIQVVTNLLSNAIKFTDRGGITCRVKVEGTVVRCEVEDTGCGIPGDMLEGVFEKFKQVGETLTERPKGTGLGLPICREIVKHHGGRIWAESEEGKGSRFIFELPLAEAAVAVEIPKEGLLESIQRHVEEGGGERILIVDDDSAIRSMLKQYLQDRGYETEEAADAKEAIGKARSLRLDLILLDIMMPGLSGYDVLRVLKNDEITRDIPVIVVSVLEDRQRALMLGASDYVTKPVDEKELFKKIRRVMGERTERQRKVVMIIDGDSETMGRLAEAMREKEFDVIESRGERQEIEDGLKRSPDLILVDVDILESFREFLEKKEIRQLLINTRFVYMIKGGQRNMK
jgi:signal transduction histidine kinase/CheY-like chemotaxis protein